MKFKLYSLVHKYLEKLKIYINSNICEDKIYKNQRTVADKMEDLCKIFFKESGFKVEEPRSNRSVEDFKLNNELIDVKTHCENKEFSMPQIISFWRYKKFLLDENEKIKNNLFELVISYIFVENKLNVTSVKFDSFFNLNVEYIRIDNLGKGLIQLNKSKCGELYIFSDNNLSNFNHILNIKCIKFYDSLIEKTKKLRSNLFEIQEKSDFRNNRNREKYFIKKNKK